MSEISEPVTKAPMWKRIIAGILDFLTIFFGGGIAIGYFFGGLTESGFQLEGGPALILFALIIGYFIVFRKYLGGTIWQRIFGIAR